MTHGIPTPPFLAIEHLTVAYETGPVVQEVSFNIWPQQIVAIVGPNGAGKTSVLKAIGGLIPAAAGHIVLAGSALEQLTTKEIVQRGVIYIPEGMSVFPEMTVVENLEIGAYLNRSALGRQMQMVFELFPELHDKRQCLAGTLSGGQQRMVTLARGLMARVRLLLLDDPFLGLSPKIVKRFCDTFKILRQCGLTLLIAGQHVRRILKVADRALLLENGAITLAGPGSQVLSDEHLQEILFGMDSTALFT